MKKQVKAELDMLKEIIVNTIPTECIYLFGSYASGTPSKDSDLDIYVVMSENAAIREIDAMLMIGRAIQDRKTMPVDIIVGKRNKFNRRSNGPTIERRIVKEGLLLYEQ